MLEGDDHARVLALEVAVGIIARELRQTGGLDLGAKLREVAGHFTEELGAEPDQMMHKLSFITALEGLAEHCENDL